MRELMNFTFENAKLPSEWMEREREYSFERGALRSGRAAFAEFILPGNGWRQFRVEMEVEPIHGAVLSCGDGSHTIVVDLKRGAHSIMNYGPSQLAAVRKEIPPKAGFYLVAFEFDDGRLRACVDGDEVVSALVPQPRPIAGLIGLQFRDDCLIRRVRVFGDAVIEKPFLSYPPHTSKEFFLEVNVDLPDDLMHAPFTRDMFDRMFTEFTSWGVKRVHWIYYGGAKSGLWDCCISGLAYRNWAKTVENVGEIFPIAVQSAHAHDLQLFGLIKPFDMGFFESFGEGTPEAKAHGKLARIGGPIGWIANFATQRRDLITSRKPGVFGPAQSKTFTRIDLVKEDDRPAEFSVDGLRLFVSDDNAAYRPYEGPMTREEQIEDYPVWEHTPSGGRPAGRNRRARVMRLKDLEVRSRYLALAVAGRGESFANTLINLIHIFGENEEERLLTYGLTARTSAGEPDHCDLRGGVQDFRTLGIEFDCWPGTPTNVFPDYDGIRARYALDGASGLLAVARGKEPAPIAMLSPSFAEVQDWWLTWVQDCLDAGADGIELRVRNHHSTLAWKEFGFEKPVRDEFLTRYGADIWKTDDFNLAVWRRLRGEAYTQFYRRVRELARRCGKPMGLHISPTTGVMEPEQGAAMEIHWDWRRWLREGLCDSVTMKEIWPRTSLAEEILSLARPRNIQTIFCPYANNLWRKPGGERVVADWIRLAREGGYDGYQLYECCAVVRAAKDGGITMEQPALRELFRRQFGK
jgi:hypothetical protein